MSSQAAHPELYGNDSLHRPDDRRPGIEEVIAGGYCVGCGGCAAVSTDRIKMKMNSKAVYLPDLGDEQLDQTIADNARKVCPFLDDGPHENELGLNYAIDGAAYSKELGWYRKLFAGHATEGEFRHHGSSGGVTSWLLNELLVRGEIDGVIEVRASSDGAEYFKYAEALEPVSVKKSSKTRYYPIEISQVVDFVRNNDGKYAFVGVPCLVKTARRLADIDKVIDERLTFFVAIVCGHMKSGRFGESLAWQMGVSHDQIETLDFRHKIPDRPASKYGFAVKPRDLPERVSPMSELAGHDWGMGMFRLKACDYCDDIVGETADVSFGDAWLPRYVNDTAGTNIIVVRNALAERILHDGGQRGGIKIEEISHADFVQSQDASFRHRRAGLAYRLWRNDRAGCWRPLKRTQPSQDTLNLIQKTIIRFRGQISAKSHVKYEEARANNDLNIYLKFVRRSTRINAVLGRISKKYSRLHNIMRKIGISH